MSPAEVEQALGAAQAHVQANRPDLAVPVLERVLQADPAHPQASRLLGLCLFRLGDAARGLACVRGALAAHPQRADLHFLLGSMLAYLGDLPQAASVLMQTLALDSRDAAAAGLLATCFLQMRDLDRAEQFYRQALALQPQYPEAACNLGLVLGMTGRPQAAAEWLVAAADRFPEHLPVLTACCMSLNYAQGIGGEEIRRRHEHFGRVLTGRVGPPRTAFPNVRDPSRRLRVAIVSPDLWDHSVAYFVRPLLEHRDRAQVEYVVFSTGMRRDWMTDRLRTGADAWYDVAGMSDEMLGERVRAAEADVALDLAGHTLGSRLAVFARRVAPVQATWLGYPNTTGVPAMDYRIVDHLTDPPDSDRLHTEHLVRLDGCFVCYAPREDAPPVSPPPCLRQGYVTFGSFNAIRKLTPATAALWAQVLHAVPGSRLVLKSAGLSSRAAREHIAALFGEQGIPESRLDLRDRIESKLGHLEAYADVDVALDTTPYNGTTTTCEALWMGVPVLSLATDRHAGRVGLSLLTAAGAGGWATGSSEAFVARACELAGDPARLGALRRSLRPQVRSSPLCDGAAFARRFERALRAMWVRYCAGLLPAALTA